MLNRYNVVVRKGRKKADDCLSCVFWWLCKLLAFCMEFDRLVLLKTVVGLHTRVLVKLKLENRLTG